MTCSFDSPLEPFRAGLSPVRSDTLPHDVNALLRVFLLPCFPCVMNGSRDLSEELVAKSNDRSILQENVEILLPCVHVCADHRVGRNNTELIWIGFHQIGLDALVLDHGFVVAMI